MKKSLLALAVLGAFAGAASAQSSVTLFGVVDLSARYVDNGAGKQYQLAQDGNSSSRIGFRGTEDLGGGLTAGFWLEGALSADTGTQGLTSINGGTNNAAATFTRRATVSLAGGWGEVRLGRDYTATFWNSTIFDPFGTNGVGSAGNLAFVMTGVPQGGSYGTIVRTNNMIGYFLPSGIAGGLYGQVQVAAGENVSGQKYFGGRIGYASGPFNVAGSYGKTQVSVPLDQDGTSYNFGGSWNFGFMTLSGYWGRMEVSDLTQDNWYIGATAPIGVWTLKASYGEVSRSGNNFNGVPFPGFDGQKADQIAIGAVYDLSKRTALYSTYSYLHNKNAAAFTVAPLINVAAGGAQQGANSTGFEVGIKHSF